MEIIILHEINQLGTAIAPIGVVGSEKLGYKKILQEQTRPGGYLFEFDEVNDRVINTMDIYTNFDKIDPTIQIIQKASAPSK